MDWDLDFGSIFEDSGSDNGWFLDDSTGSGDWLSGGTDWLTGGGDGGGGGFLEEGWLDGIMGGIGDVADGVGDVVGGMGSWGSIVGNLVTGAGVAKDIYSLFQDPEQRGGGQANAQALLQAGMSTEMMKMYLDNLKKTQPLYDKQIQTEMDLSGDYDTGKKTLVRKLLEGEDVVAKRYMDQASTDVASDFTMQRDMDSRRMGMMGLNPNSGQYQNYLDTMGKSEALAHASARTMASRQAEDTALARNAQAINLQMGIPLPSAQYAPGAGIKEAYATGAYTDRNTQDLYKGIGAGINKLFKGV